MDKKSDLQCIDHDSKAEKADHDIRHAVIDMLLYEVEWIVLPVLVALSTGRIRTGWRSTAWCYYEFLNCVEGALVSRKREGDGRGGRALGAFRGR
jgi:hypothetical protein